MYSWCGFQRSRLKAKTIPASQIKLLDSISFPWNKPEQNFLNSFFALESFVKKHKRIPYTRETWEGVKVGLFVKTARQLYSRGKLPPNRTKKLTKLGVEFENENYKNNRIFLDKASATAHFISSQGKSPKQGQKWQGFEVGNFLHNQKKEIKLGKLSKERIDILESKGISLKKS